MRDFTTRSGRWLHQALGLLSHERVRTLVSVLADSRGPQRDAASHLGSAMEWLCRAQDATGSGGVSYGYGVLEGWWPEYPETTGYCIPTFLRYARLTGEQQFRDRALRMAEWELTVQSPDGGIVGGPLSRKNHRPRIAFDTGQVLQGWVAAYRETGDVRFLDASERAAGWLVANNRSNGGWHDHDWRGRFRRHAYDARTAWALLELYDVAPQSAYREAAQQNLDWTMQCQLANGWFRENSFEPGAPALTHTIAYVLEGLVESWRRLQDARLLEAAVRGAEALREQYERGGWLPATFDARWESRDHYSCVTGCAQSSIVWLQLSRITGQPEFRDAALRMNCWLRSVQVEGVANADARGGIPGSHPCYGAYERLRLPNWAAKFFADAMLAECELSKDAQER
jgi:hypothetical protein